MLTRHAVHAQVHRNISMTPQKKEQKKKKKKKKKKIQYTFGFLSAQNIVM